jgi:hypothetical protein
MGPTDLFWHLANLLAPALGLGIIAASLAKLLWREALRQMPWARLAAWLVAGNAVVVVAGLVLQGRDGRMATYAAMVAVSAALLWWRGVR